MAEIAAAAAAIATTVLKFSEVLSEQADFLLDVRDKIEWLKRELSWMQSFLKDAENKLDGSNLIQEWVSEVRDLAYDCEDVIDTFLLKLERGPGTKVAGRFGAVSRRFVACAAGRQVEKLRERVNDISSRRERYGLNADVSSTSSDTKKREKKLKDTRRSAPYANNEHMVGLAETISFLKGKLTNGGSGRFVVSIVGMGGLGKTTLARKLYNSLGQEYFESRAWVCVSQEYNTRDILLQLIKSIANPTNEVLESLTTIDSMEAYLRSWLTGRCFLAVIDDVWEKQAWESLERAFPDDNKNSRVIITTRNKQVAAANSAYVHELRYLQEDESWELFCQKAFPDDNEMICPLNLEQLGKEMVAKCSGLPLAIITLGGLLSTKSHTISEWEGVRDNLWKELKKNSEHINAVLMLSFNDLPHNLKPCFLYVAMFPEDFEIPISKLMLLWVAEGFIRHEAEEDGCPEDVAKSYFDELVGRSLFQKKSEDWIDSTCRVHDLLRDMAISKAKEVCFSLYYDGKQTSGLSKAPPHRRLAYVFSEKIPSNYVNPSLRTFCQPTATNCNLSIPYISTSKLLRPLHERFSLLRVLDIQVGNTSLQVTRIPGEIGRLIHLRYLGLGLPVGKIVQLPETIGNLKALETFSVGSGVNVTLRKAMVKLKNLKHLIGTFNSTCDWIGRLIGLETLGGINYQQWCDIDTASLVNLCHLSLTIVPEDQAKPTRFYDKFRSLTKLHTLALYNQNFIASSSISISEIFKRCPSITHFLSSGMSYHRSPELHEFAMNLQILEMELYDPHHALIPSIEKLPRLLALRIRISGGNMGAKQLVCSEGGFAQLRTLKLEMNGACEFVVREGVMPLLTHLEVNKPERFMAPDRLMQLVIKTS